VNARRWLLLLIPAALLALVIYMIISIALGPHP
jgi:hypothetical protein